MNINALLEAEATQSAGSPYFSILMIVLMVAIFYFMLIRPQKKRDKEMAKMRSNIQVGDEVITAGGIIGRVVIVKEDTLVIETGNDRSKIRIAKWAVQVNNSLDDQASAAKEKEKEESKDNKEEKKELKEAKSEKKGEKDEKEKE